MSDHGLVIDLFAGGGGASTGIEAALGRPVDLAVNHSATAIAVHTANHPRTHHLTCDVYEVDPIEATQGRPVDVLWGSPDCRDFSKAKGSKPKRPRSKKIRALAWVIVRWAQAVRPRVLFVENVEEFQGWGPLGRDGERIPERVGETFRAWVGKLRRLGYAVEWRVLDASQYGAPTRRKRLFIVARCDGRPIVWPTPTHGPGLLPYRTAGECIDWTIPTRSIFGRKKPLAEKTLRRIAEGIRRFVLESPRPYIVRVNHGRDVWRGQGTDEPLTTVEATQRGHALVTPAMVRMAHGEGKPGAAQRRGHGAHAAEEPLPTVTGSSGGGGFAVAAPVLTKYHGGERPRVPPIDEPMRTIDTSNRFGLATPVLVKFRHDSKGAPLSEPAPTITGGGDGPGRGAGAAHALGLATPILVQPGQRHGRGQRPADVPLGTIVAKDRHAVAVAGLVNTRNGERQGQRPRVRSTQEPHPTVTSEGSQGAIAAVALAPADLPLVAAQDRAVFIAKHFGGVVGHAAEERLGTVTGRDHHSLVAANLVTFRGDPSDHPGGSPLDEPMPTITAQGLHLAECRAFLTKFYSCPRESGASLFEPAPTVTGKARFGLVLVDGVEYEIGDIFLRMLEPEELLRAQFGEHADGYDLSAAVTKEAKTKLVGNSVPPDVVRALVAANVPAAQEAVA